MTAAADHLSPEQTLSKALTLADKGYHLFPVRVSIDPITGANTKTYVTGKKDSPTGAEWNATRDPELIATWWGTDGRFNDCMIGIATGPSGVVLLDLDTKHGQDGPGEWAQLHPEPYPFPAAVGTSSTGGKHLAYRADPKCPVRTVAGMLAPGIDTRGVGGMFVCWASWLPKVADLPPVPAVIPERVPYAKREIIIPVAVDPSTFAATDVVQERVLEHHAIVAEAEEGEGVPKASRQSYFVGQYVGAGQVEESWATAVMLSAIEGWTWAQPGDRAKVEHQILKGVADGKREPRPWVAESTLATVTVLRPQATAPTAPEQPQEPRTSPFSIPGTSSPTQDPDGAPEGERESETTHGRHLRAVSASSIRPRRVRWTWEGRWPQGAITLVAGQQGLGKSTIVYDRASAITRGELEGEFLGAPRAVLVCATEDSWEYTIIPRLMAAGADLDHVYKIDVLDEDIETELILPRDVLAIERLTSETGAVLLILDPITSRLDGGLDSHKDSETRRALEPLARMADRSGLCVVGLMHMSKANTTDPLKAVMGATAFTAVARSVSVAMFDPDDEDRRRKLFGTPKCNVGRNDLPMLLFVTVGTDIETDDGPTNVGRIEWLGEADGSIADAMERAQQDPETRTAVGDAAEWLRQHLTACGGQADSMSVREAAKGEGHNVRTVQRALKKLGGRVESVPNAFPRRTLYTLPDKKDKVTLISSGDTLARQPLQTPKPVVTVVTDVSVEGQNGHRRDSGDSADEFECPEALSRQAVATVEGKGDLTGSGAPEAPADSMAEMLNRRLTGDCPCGQPAERHRPALLMRCGRCGTVWHALGHRALKSCPGCAERETVTAGGDVA